MQIAGAHARRERDEQGEHRGHGVSSHRWSSTREQPWEVGQSPSHLPQPVMVAHSAPVRMARARGLRLRPAGARRARRRRASRRPRPAHRGHRPQGPADRRRQQRADLPCDRRPLRHDPLDAADAGERGQVRLALLRAGRADPGHPRVALVERLVHARLRERHDRRDRRAAATGGGGAGLRLLAVGGGDDAGLLRGHAHRPRCPRRGHGHRAGGGPALHLPAGGRGVAARARQPQDAGGRPRGPRARGRRPRHDRRLEPRAADLRRERPAGRVLRPPGRPGRGPLRRGGDVGRDRSARRRDGATGRGRRLRGLRALPRSGRAGRDRPRRHVLHVARGGRAEPRGRDRQRRLRRGPRPGRVGLGERPRAGPRAGRLERRAAGLLHGPLPRPPAAAALQRRGRRVPALRGRRRPRAGGRLRLLRRLLALGHLPRPAPAARAPPAGARAPPRALAARQGGRGRLPAELPRLEQLHERDDRRPRRVRRSPTRG